MLMNSYTICLENVIEKSRKKKYKIIGIGVDYGQQNATTYQTFGLNIDRGGLDGLQEYYYSGRDTGKQKSPSEYAKELGDMTDELHEEYQCSFSMSI